MERTDGARGRATWLAIASTGLLGVLAVMVGPAADPAFACDCGVPSDAAAFEESDAVFVGELVGYEPPPNRVGMSSADPATWIFEVSEVYKGEVSAIQEIVSEVSGASCGLEIPREGEFVIFGTEQAFEMEVGDGQYYAGLCGGTRATSAGPLAVDVAPSPPASAQETTSTTNADGDTEAAAGPPHPGEGTPDETSMSVMVIGVTLAVAATGMAVLIWRRVGYARR